jgi:hypothetical protein
MGADRKALADTLEHLDRELAARAPEIHRALHPGLDAGLVDDAMKAFSFDVPQAVKDLYTWHDGAEKVEGTERAEVFPNAQMLPLAEMSRLWAEILEANKANEKNPWDRRWLPLFVGYKWAFWVVDCGLAAGPVKVFDWVDLPVTWTAYQDLNDWSERVLRCWVERAYRQGAHASVEEDRVKAAEVNRSMDGRADVEQLIADLKSGSGPRYSDALAKLRTRLYPEAVPGLIRLMKSKERGRVAAAELLAWIGGAEALECLRLVSESEPDERIRRRAQHELQEAKLRSIWDTASQEEDRPRDPPRSS